MPLIFVIDHDPQVLDFIATVLRLQAHEVRTFRNVQSAWKSIRTEVRIDRVLRPTRQPRGGSVSRYSFEPASCNYNCSECL